MLNVHELNVFVEAAQAQNFSVAAHRLRLSQPAVSLQIRNLERQLGIELFTRNGRNVVLSEAGKLLLPLAQDLLHGARHVEETMWGLQGLIIGRLSLACSTAVGKYVIPRLVAGFHSCYPDVYITVDTVGRRLAPDLLLEGQVDIAVVSHEAAHRDLEFRSLLTDQIVLVVPVGHPWGDGRAVEPRELAKIPMLMDDAATPSYEVVAGWLAGHRLAVTDLQVVATLGTPEAAELMVEAGAGAAFLPRAIAARGLALGCIKEVTVRAMPLERTIYLARQLRRSPGPAERAFWDFAFDPANETLRRPAF